MGLATVLLKHPLPPATPVRKGDIVLVQIFSARWKITFNVVSCNNQSRVDRGFT